MRFQPTAKLSRMTIGFQWAQVSGLGEVSHSTYHGEICRNLTLIGGTDLADV